MYAITRTLVVPAVATVGLLVSGPPVVAQTLDEDGLQEALLNAVDFPAGWAEESEEAVTERGLGVPQPKERDCRELFEGSADELARAGFARSHTGPFVTTTAAAHGDVDEAKDALAAAEVAAEDCTMFHTEEGPAGASVRVAYESAPLEVDELGDGQVALSFHRSQDEDASTPVTAEVVVVRVDSHLVRVAQAARADMDAGSVEKVAERAVEKIRQVAKGDTPVPPGDSSDATEL